MSSSNNTICAGATINIHSGQGNGRPAEEVWALLYPVTKTNHIKMLCINDLPQLKILIPDVDTWLSQAIGGL